VYENLFNEPKFDISAHNQNSVFIVFFNNFFEAGFEFMRKREKLLTGTREQPTSAPLCE